MVLQLDLCDFTTFSKSVEASELAAVMHVIFSEFDAALASHPQVHKLDTIGDAYMAAVFLPGQQWADGPDEVTAHIQQRLKNSPLESLYGAYYTAY